MSVYSSLYIGMSGMQVNEAAIGIIGNNIANMNTVGFKASRGNFADMFSQTLYGQGGMLQLGMGATVQGSQRLHLQGAVLGTGVTTDMAINGNGLFAVKGGPGESAGMFYTRNGQFQLDKEGFLTVAGGYRLQGYPANAEGKIGHRLGDLNLSTATSPPKATTGVALKLNLDASSVPATDTFDPADPEATAAYSTSVTVHDSLGKSHQLDVYFVKTDEGQWEWHALADGGEIEGGTAGEPIEVASGELSFTSDGLLDSESLDVSSVEFLGAEEQELEFDFGEALADGGDGSGTTGYGSPSSTDFISQDGFGTGKLQVLTIGLDGVITGTFSNGQTRDLGQVALATFQNPTDLESIGGNLFAATRLSGPPTVGAAATAGRGEVLSGALEQSNVDLTAEFTNMIISQRGYQASSRTITTADQLLNEVVNLKR